MEGEGEEPIKRQEDARGTNQMARRKGQRSGGGAGQRGSQLKVQLEAGTWTFPGLRLSGPSPCSQTRVTEIKSRSFSIPWVLVAGCPSSLHRYCPPVVPRVRTP